MIENDNHFVVNIWKSLLGELLNGSLEIIECEVYDQLQLS
jgi:hypothetical protein